MLTEETNKRVQTSYTYGNTRESGNSIWEDSRDCIANVTSYYQYNGHGDVTSRTNDDGMVTNVYQYTPFGQVTLGSAAYEGFFAYGGESYNPNTGLEYLRARYYDTGNGNFLTEDTYLGNLIDPLTRNRYSYVKNNPVNYVDPSGHRLQTPMQRVSTSKKGSNKKTGSVKTSRNSSTSSKPASSKKGAAITTAKTVTKAPAPKVTKAPNHSGGKASGGNRASTSQDNPSPAPAPTISRHLKENASPQIPAVTKHTVEEVSGWAKAKEIAGLCANGAYNVTGGAALQFATSVLGAPLAFIDLFSPKLKLYQNWEESVFERATPFLGFDTQSITFNAGRMVGAVGAAYYGTQKMFSGLNMAPGGMQIVGNGTVVATGIKIIIENEKAFIGGGFVAGAGIQSAAETLPIKSQAFRDFLREQGYNPKNWVKVVEKWASPDGVIYQRNYWTNGTDYFYHGEGIEEFYPH